MTVIKVAGADLEGPASDYRRCTTAWPIHRINFSTPGSAMTEYDDDSLFLRGRVSVGNQI